MKFGYFDDKSKEYVITVPKTPYPWINYLGSQEYFCLLSNTGGGYSFYKDASKLRITRYRYNNVPLDHGGKYYYIYEDGMYWSPTWAPVKAELDAYECRHGLGYSRITGEKEQIRAELLFLVPLNYNCEIHQLKLTNQSSRERKLKIFSLVEFCLWDAQDDMTNFQRNYSIGEVEVDGATIYHKTEYRERRNHYAFFTVNQPIVGMDTDREAFLGMYNGFHDPDAVKEGQPRNSLANGWSPIASHCLEITLAPGEEKTCIFLLGYVENALEEKWEAPGIINKTKAQILMQNFSTPEQVEHALAELCQYWDSLLSSYQLTFADEKLNRMVNIWNQYQCMMTFNMSRSASYFESGISRGIGFRDSNQDLLGIVHMVPERARQRLIDLASTQFSDGSAFHQYQPLTRQGNNAIGSGFNDDPLWLIMGTTAYIKETGDYTILDVKVPFNDGTRANLFDHLRASFLYVVNNLGPHGLPLIGRADWNDCLNLSCFSGRPGESFQTTAHHPDSQAESVMIAGLLITVGPDFVVLCLERGEEVLAKEAIHAIDVMKDAILNHGLADRWFLRAYDYYGQKIGGDQSTDEHEPTEDGQIYIEPQGFCIMGGLGLEDGFALKALDAVRDRLDTQYGLVLLDPSYQQYHLALGEISSYPPGYKENGGIFCHTNPWIMIAETRVGRGEQAFTYYKKIAPAYLEEIHELHKTEPYVYSQMIAGKDAINHGQAKNSWLTGTAAWNYVAITQWILGIRPEFDGLRVDPCIPCEWRELTVTRKFRGSTYIIQITNPDSVSKGVRQIRVDGKIIQGTMIPPLQDGAIHQVEVVLGANE